MNTPYTDISSWWSSRPCNSRHSDLPVGSFAYFQQVRERRYKVEPHIIPFADFPHWWGRNVLDIGCGIGTDTIEFALHDAKVVAVDISDRSLALTADRARVYGLSHKVTTVLANMEDLSTEIGGNFHLIWAWGSIHHTPNPRLALNEIRRLCSSYTTVKLMLYNSHSTKALGLRLRHGINASHFSEAQEGCPVTHWYTPRQAVKLVEDAGFIVSSCKVDFIFPYDVAAYRMHKYIRRFPWNLIQGKAFRWMERHFGWNLLLEARPNCAHVSASQDSGNSAPPLPPFSPDVA